MGFLARLGIGMAAGGAITWLAAAGIAAAIAAIGFGLIEYGIFLRASKVQDQILQEVKINRERNFQVDRKTIDKDSILRERLDEIERTWAPPKPIPAERPEPVQKTEIETIDGEGFQGDTWIKRQLP